MYVIQQVIELNLLCTNLVFSCPRILCEFQTRSSLKFTVFVSEKLNSFKKQTKRRLNTGFNWRDQDQWEKRLVPI